MHRLPRRRADGVSMIEALVALAIMAFGMLGIVGVQSTLRLNSDIAKQRSEAVRIGQQSNENARSFTRLATAAGFSAYDDVAGTTLSRLWTNTTYTLVRGVTPSGDTGDSDDPRFKVVNTTVSWVDRTGQMQSVELNTAIARVMPELAGTLSLPSNVDANGLPTRGPMARNAAIPLGAANFGSSGTSGYIPPGRQAGDQTAWRYSNASGLITFCTTTLTDNAALAAYFQTNGTSPLVCSGANAWPLGGYVAFASNADPQAQALAPSGTPQAVAVSLSQTHPTTGTVGCYSAAPQSGIPYVAYLCAVPVQSLPAPPHPARAWSGSTSVTVAGAPRICRYTTTTTPVQNWQHPLVYTDVTAPLVQQNFLVLPAGTACPTLPGTQTTASP